MGNYSSAVWTIIITIITFLLAFFIYFFGFGNMKNTLTSDNLQDAVRTSAYMARDNSARTERGSFIINKSKFKDYLSKTKIKQFGKAKLGNGHVKYTVYYLPDNAKADSNVDNHNQSNGNDSHITNNKSAWVADHDTTANKVQDGDGYEAVRGIRVVVQEPNKPGIIGKRATNDHNPNSKDNKAVDKSMENSKKYGTFTATDIVQTYGKNANKDTYNDLTR